jgi:hypothetical protein
MVKAVDMVRKIRDRHYEQTKGLSVKEQIEFVKKKSEKLKKKIKSGQRSTADNRAQTTKV